MGYQTGKKQAFFFKMKNLFILMLFFYKSYRPSTPIKNVIGNLYGLESEQVLFDIYSTRLDQVEFYIS